MSIYKTAIINFCKNGRNSRFFEDTMDWKINTEFTDSVRVMKLDHKKSLGSPWPKKLLSRMASLSFRLDFLNENEVGTFSALFSVSAAEHLER